jgi:hypothetical protein
MGLNPDELPDNIKDKVADPAERKRLGPTLIEQIAERDEGQEKKIRKQIISFAERNRIIVDTPNHHRKSRLANGRPDLLLTKDCRALYLELKSGTNKLSPEQEAYILKLIEAGNRVHVVRSYQAGAAIIIEFFGL